MSKSISEVLKNTGENLVRDITSYCEECELKESFMCNECVVQERLLGEVSHLEKEDI